MTEPDIVGRVGQYAAATLFEASDDVAALAPTIAPLYRPIRLSGPAYTILADPGDNLAVHLGLTQASPGSVLVVASGMEVEKGFWGEVMMEAALARGPARAGHRWSSTRHRGPSKTLLSGFLRRHRNPRNQQDFARQAQ